MHLTHRNTIARHFSNFDKVVGLIFYDYLIYKDLKMKGEERLLSSYNVCDRVFSVMNHRLFCIGTSTRHLWFVWKSVGGLNTFFHT